jgi:hypothetical protein
MTMLRTIGPVALLMVSGELPALAQAAVQDPGAYAFYHPNADVLNAGRPSVRSTYPLRLCKQRVLSETKNAFTPSPQIAVPDAWAAYD